MSVLSIQNERFLIDGKETVIISGTIHYFRVIPAYWEDRLKKLKACGFNTVETYVCWNLHERREGQFDFSGGLDLARFLQIAKDIGLYVILRPGPYICAEWEMGGLPSWLLNYPRMRLRCNDPLFLKKVQRFYEKLFSYIAPYLSTNGGNIIAVQVENEYGSYGDDKAYLSALADMIRDNGCDCLLFTSDGTAEFMLGGGLLDGVLATANFGSHPRENFSALREFRPDSPLMCTEYWNGWFDHWYEEHHTRTCQDTAQVLEEILAAGASVNFYMFHGGTNFGFTNGANYDDFYMPTVTSYDYDCPVSECGDLTPKYFEIKKVIEHHLGKAPDLDVHNLPKKAYGTIRLTEQAGLFDNLEALSFPVCSAVPLTMEELGQDFGFVLYSTTIDGPIHDREVVTQGLHDRGHFFVDGVLQGIRQRDHRREDPITMTVEANKQARLDILVENMGRVNYGRKLRDEKGITGSVRISQRHHFGWTMYPLPLEDLSGLQFQPAADSPSQAAPVFLSGRFAVEEPMDTFIRLDGFTKGVVFVNGFNIGRYWNEAGPQKTLYIPGPLLKKGENQLIVFEVDGFDRYEVTLTDRPDLG